MPQSQTMIHADIIVMRGIVLETDDGRPPLLKYGERTHPPRSNVGRCPFWTNFPSIEDIKDKAKTDFLGKAISLLQIS